MKIILNADDCGASKRHTDLNLELLSANRISSTSFMVNSGYSETAADLICDRKPDLISRIGLHLNLTTGSPLNERLHGSPLVDAQNHFSDFRERLGTAASLKFVASLRQEIDLQVQWFRERFGRYPAHVDAHNHVFQSSPAALLALLTSTRARYIRYARPVRRYDHDTGHGKRAGMRKVVNRLLRLRFKTPDYFTDIRTLDGRFISEKALAFLGARYRVIEIMCHPYYKDESEYEFLRNENLFDGYAGDFITYDSLDN